MIATYAHVRRVADKEEGLVAVFRDNEMPLYQECRAGEAEIVARRLLTTWGALGVRLVAVQCVLLAAFYRQLRRRKQRAKTVQAAFGFTDDRALNVKADAYATKRERERARYKIVKVRK